MFRLESRAPRFWLLMLLVTIVLLWALKPILLPFATGMTIAYFLNPAVEKIARHGVPRGFGALIVLLAFLLIISLIALLVVPMLQEQIGALVDAVPGYVQKVRDNVLPRFEGWLSRFSPDDIGKLRDAAGEYVGNAAGIFGKALQKIISGGLALIDIFALMFVTPVIAFYVLRDWPRLTESFNSLIPRRHYDTIHEQMANIDRTLAGFLRGQALVCVCLGFIYGIGLALAGIPYSAAIGVIAGILSFIPFVGTAFAWVTSLSLALVQFEGFGHVGMVLGVLLFEQVVESYFLTPRLVGDRVGLHPVWILFAIFAGAQLMGFVGVLIAMPLAAVIGVLTRFALKRYKQSSVYQDPAAPIAP